MQRALKREGPHFLLGCLCIEDLVVIPHTMRDPIIDSLHMPLPVSCEMTGLSASA